MENGGKYKMRKYLETSFLTLLHEEHDAVKKHNEAVEHLLDLASKTDVVTIAEEQKAQSAVSRAQLELRFAREKLGEKLTEHIKVKV